MNLSPIKLKYIFHFVILLIFQLFFLNTFLNLHGFVQPYIYFIFLLWFPLNYNLALMYLWAILLGFSMDIYTLQLGKYMAATNAVVFLRNDIFRMVSRNWSLKMDKEYEITLHNLGWRSYILYVSLLAFIHSAVITIYEWLQVSINIYLFINLITSTIVSTLLAISVEIFINRIKFRK